jgi:preprotein translocase subunit SecG
MQQLTIIIHILTALSIIALILMQRGKGSDVGAAFGSGASQTMFGSKGSFPFLCKVIGVLAGIFFVTSIVLNYFNANMVKKNNENDLPISITETEKNPTTTEVKPQPVVQQETGASKTIKDSPKN